MGSSQSWARYTYVLGSPVALVDPNGKRGIRESQSAINAWSERSQFVRGGRKALWYKRGSESLAKMNATFCSDAEALGAASDPILRPEIRVGISHFFRDAGWGNDETGRSAWIVSGFGGRLSLVRWPWSAASGLEKWTGPLPSGLLANVHTHPSRSRAHASNNDKAAATISMIKRRHRPIPIYTLHRTGMLKWDSAIHKPEDDGSMILGAAWWKLPG